VTSDDRSENGRPLAGLVGNAVGGGTEARSGRSRHQLRASPQHAGRPLWTIRQRC
jgi:hypothetical protein